MKRYRIAVDIGGTFVDAIAFDRRTGKIKLEKAPTTPAWPTRPRSPERSSRTGTGCWP